MTPTAPAPSIAAQVHRVLVAQEEARCLALEQEKGKPVRRREIPVPAVRMGPTALCQNTDFLVMVTEYDYDLSDQAFLVYCRQRGSGCGAVPSTRRWEIFARHGLRKEAYLADPYFQFAEEYQGSRHQYTDDEMESGWQVIHLGRAVLEDAWEVYREGVAQTLPPAPVTTQTPGLFDEE